MSTTLKMSINLKKLTSVGVMDVKGSKSTQKCIVIPIEANHIFMSDKGAYLDIVGFEIKERGDKKETHLLKQSMPKAIYEKMTEEDRKNQPLLGNATVTGAQTTAPANNSQSNQSSSPYGAHNAPSADDLPF